jgi:Transcriptional antiterminator
MKVVKNINNNVSICIDSKGREVVAFGKGLGFIKPPYSVDLNKVERTFYNIQDLNFEGIKDIPFDTMKAAIRIVDDVEKSLNITLMSTAALSLADHINFAIKRLTKHIPLEMPIQEDIKQLYPEEMQKAYVALEIIKEETDVLLSKEEAGNIALHFINSKMDNNIENTGINQKIIEKSSKIIENRLEISISKESFNYSRFVTHIDYLLRRVFKNRQITSQNISILSTIKEEYPQGYECAGEISDLFKQEVAIDLSEEEKLYLILHINRLYVRETVI